VQLLRDFADDLDAGGVGQRAQFVQRVCQRQQSGSTLEQRADQERS
jgi:hypothetical protein